MGRPLNHTSKRVPPEVCARSEAYWGECRLPGLGIRLKHWTIVTMLELEIGLHKRLGSVLALESRK
jgi:hypothetical protein